MASEGRGKLKAKRNQSTGKPYDRKSSLFGKIKSSVKDLLIPSWLSRTPSQPESEQEPSSSGQHGVPYHLSSSDYLDGSKLLRPASETVSGHTNRSVPEAIKHLELKSQQGDLTLPGFHPQSELSLSRNSVGEQFLDSSRRDFPAPNVNVGSLDQGGGRFNKNTRLESGMSVSTTVGGGPTDQSRLRMSDSNLEKMGDEGVNVEPTPIRPVTVSTSSQRSNSKSAAKRQRLWSPEVARQGRPLVPPVKETPAFNSLLFGTPKQNDSSQYGDSFRESSFYSGKTRFGGASAGERKMSLNTPLPYQASLPLRKQVTVNKLNNTLQATTSATAQRILETLDRMSTPLRDAKRIPQAEADDSVLSFTPLSYRRRSLLGLSSRPTTRPLQIPPSRGPPTSQYQTASHAMIARNRFRPTGTNNSRETLHDTSYDDKDEGQKDHRPGLAISQEQMSVTDELAFSTDPALTTGGSRKMKTKRFSQHASNTNQDYDEVIEMPSLRTDFTLPVSAMNPICMHTMPAKAYTLPTVTIPSTLATDLSPLKFTFSTPIQEKRGLSNHQPLGTKEKDFTFSSPIQAMVGKTSGAGAEEGSKTSPEPAVGASSVMGLTASFSPAQVPAWGSTAPKPKASSPDIGGTSSSFKSYSKWGVNEKNNDISAASDGTSGGGFSLAPASSLKTGSVMDILGGKASSVNAFSSTGTDSLMAKFQKPAGSWDCDTCMVQNSASVQKCVACESPKPGPQSASVDPLMAKFMKPVGNWECDSCMVQNSATALKCIACESPKPGPQSSGGDGTDTLMAKFQKPAGSWECDTCMVQNSATALKCAACESPKPGLQSAGVDSFMAKFKKPQGSWECDTCMVQNSSTALRCVACDSPKPGLQSAGIVSTSSVNGSESASSIAISPTGGFTINLPATTTTTTGSGGFKFGNTDISSAPSASAPAPTGFVFGQTASKDLKNNSASDSNKISSATSGFTFGGSNSSTGTGLCHAATAGFVFGSSVVSTAKSGSEGGMSKGFQFGASSGSVNVTSDSSSLTQTSEESVGNVNNDSLNKSNNFVAPATASFQFGTGSTSGSINSVVDPPGSKEKQPSAEEGFAKVKDITTVAKSAEQQHINFGFSTQGSSSAIAAGSTALFSLPAYSQASTSTPTSVPKQAHGLFNFGSAVPGMSSSDNSKGLGMGNSLSDVSKSGMPLVNGAFGSGQGNTKLFSPEGSKLSEGFGAGAVTPVFGGFAQGAPALSQTAPANKRSVDFVDVGAPSTKRAFNFGSEGTEATTNGLFAFGGSGAPSGTSLFGSTAVSVGTSTAPTAGGFGFGSKPTPSDLTSGTAAGGGFQFGSGPGFGQLAASTAPGGGFSFAFKGQEGVSTPNTSVQLAASKGTAVSFNMTPNFNFSGSSQAAPSAPTALFQFGANPTEKSAPTPATGLFQFGTVPTPSIPAAADKTTFGGPPAGVGSVGNFNIGSVDSSGRKMKKAVRRIKK